MADAVARDAEQRRDQRSEVLEGGEKVSISTDCVSTRMYQPRMSVSISNAHEVGESAGHWKRKLRTRNGASAA